MLRVTYQSREYVLARTWDATAEVELVDTTTCSVLRVPATSIAGVQPQSHENTTLPRETGFVPFTERSRDFIRLNQERRRALLLSYRGKKHARRRRDETSEDSVAFDEWGAPISKAPKASKARSGSSSTGSARGTKGSSRGSKLNNSLATARQNLAQKGLGDLFD